MKTFDDIEKLAMTDHVVHRCMMMYRKGEFTKEQALIHMVTILAEQKDDLFKEAVKLHQNSPNRGGLVNPDGGNYPLKWMTEGKAPE